MGTVITQASIMALLSMFVGVLPLGLGIVYAIWPNEQRLAVMRPLSLATIFAALSGSTLGVINALRPTWIGPTLELSRNSVIGFAEALVPMFLNFGCLTAAWLCVAIGLWRRS